jgi:hypothetical protein
MGVTVPIRAARLFGRDGRIARSQWHAPGPGLHTQECAGSGGHALREIERARVRAESERIDIEAKPRAMLKLIGPHNACFRVAFETQRRQASTMPRAIHASAIAIGYRFESHSAFPFVRRFD